MRNHNQETIHELIAQLKTAAEEAVIVVEGKKDKQALSELGIDSKIFLLQANCRQFAEPRISRNSSVQNNKSLIELSEELAAFSKVILMLDLDSKGRELTRKMKTHLQAQGAKVDTKLGKKLLYAARTQTVESLKF